MAAIHKCKPYLGRNEIHTEFKINLFLPPFATNQFKHFSRCTTIARNEWMLFLCVKYKTHTNAVRIYLRNSEIKRMKPSVWKVLYAHLLWNKIDKYVTKREKAGKKCCFWTKYVFPFLWTQRKYLTWGNMRSVAAIELRKFKVSLRCVFFQVNMERAPSWCGFSSAQK